eukprot:CAMPEP_0194143318 /NCGR_PEP_ID=MMETSP0152-20130528/12504_1 /TAXON_ID=1049557 /ORGANISM="Thalassiothrix antarctica, Strain L6-D1" /LENGTH=30 /DNA_ID= /DNA_START= /DNA_END= /DNA_ORIENTATION=
MSFALLKLQERREHIFPIFVYGIPDDADLV